jgi:hypothetical protein
LVYYLDNVLLPKAREDDILCRVTGNKWDELGCRTQIKTYTVKWKSKKAQEGEKGKKEEWRIGQTPYTAIRGPTNLGKKARGLQRGLDPFHTPQNKRIGLTRHLGLGAEVVDDRTLRPPEAPCIGILPRCIPFLQHDDPRRALMACSMMAQAVPVMKPELPQVMTSFEKDLRKSMPQQVEDVGVNLRVGFLFWKCLNYEDAVVVSESAAEKLHVREIRRITVPLPCFTETESVSNEDFDRGIRRVSTTVAEQDELVKLSYSPLRLGLNLKKLPANLRKDIKPFAASIPWRDHSLRSPCAGRIIESNEVPLYPIKAAFARHVRARADFTIQVDRPLQLGDKLCNRHGNKGVVSAIVPDGEMPIANGQPLEVLFSPIGVLNRGNYGQLLEALCRSAAEPGIALSPDPLPDPGKALRPLLASMEDGCTWSEVRVPDPDSPYLVHAITGVNYILRLPQHSDDTFNVCGKAPISRMTGQPPQGVAQKYGEMEIWALQAHGAHHILDELCHQTLRLQGNGAEGSASGMSKVISEWLKVMGFNVTTENGLARLTTTDLNELPTGSQDLMADMTSEAAPLCSSGGKGEIPRAVTLLRRLQSQAFSEEIEDLHLNLGQPINVSVKVSPRESISWSGRHIPILPAQYRVWACARGDDDVTRKYGKLTEAVWRIRKSGTQTEGAPDAIQKPLKSLLYEFKNRMNGKNGVIRKIGLCRRLHYSGRFVIIPDPLLPVDTISIPWGAARELYRLQLCGNTVAQRRLKPFLNAAQKHLPPSQHGEMASAINDILAGEVVLLNRNPSLHKYSILAFRPRVHFDTRALKIPPGITNPFSADFDGDTMTVVPLFSDAAKTEARSMMVTNCLISDADGHLIPELKKDLLLGFSEILGNGALLAALNEELSSEGLRSLEATDPTQAKAAFEGYLNRNSQDDTAVVRFFSIVTDHVARAVSRVTKQSAFGDVGALSAFFEGQTRCAAAKKKLENEDKALLTGVPLSDLVALADTRISNLVNAEVSKGKFGGYLRRLYYRFDAAPANGLAFDGGMRAALVSAQSITERATQQALGQKSGSKPLEFEEFDRALRECLDPANAEIPAQAVKSLCQQLDFEPEALRHLTAIRDVVLRECDPTSFLQILNDPLAALALPSTEATQVDDPRVAVFLCS